MSMRSFDTPLGRVTLTEDAGAITRLSWCGNANDDTPLLRQAEAQLAAYFAGTRAYFDLPTRATGSDAQRRVCAAMAAIPAGGTRTYGDLARDLGLSAQAVGQLCGRNPIPVIIPCHRVLGAQGLGGFSAPGGIETKVWLLRHERAAGLLI
jgi:methylated-DNA-[protein]-cysteine S-methyltransferase